MAYSGARLRLQQEARFELASRLASAAVAIAGVFHLVLCAVIVV